MSQACKIIALVVASAVIGNAQTIDLSGKITNGFGGSPVAGAAVKLSVKNISTVSAADGSYRIRFPNATLPQNGSLPIRGGFSIKGDKVSITLAPNDRFTIELFDLKGRSAWKTARAGQPGGANQEVVLPLEKIAGQTGLARVTIGAERTFFRYVKCDRGSPLFVRLSAPPAAYEQSVHALAKTIGTLPILDTLIASSTSITQNNAIRLYVYNLIDTIDVSLGELDSFSEARQQVVHRINTYRATLHLKHLIRYAAKEFCIDSQAMNDCNTNTAHGAFGRCKEMAQNECPGWGGTTLAAALNSIITGCLQSMWDEGPGTPYSAHGHYINMTDTTKTKTAGGFYWVASTKKLWATQDFWP